jgi:integration host factor subunit beta
LLPVILLNYKILLPYFVKKVNHKMTKTQLIDAIHEKSTGLTKLQVANVVDAMTEAMTTALAKGGKVEIRGFGNFTVRQREARKVRNPKTGEMVEVPAKQVPHFKPGKELKTMVKGD